MAVDKDTSSVERIVVRLRISDRDTHFRLQWLNRLTEAGCKILSVGRFGLDVEMDEKSIDDLLGLTLVLRDEHHRLEFKKVPKRDEGLSIPDAYIPAKPINF